MVTVSFEEVESLLERLAEINAVPFDEIEWTKDGKTLDITPEVRNDWKFMGLGNSTFVELASVCENVISISPTDSGYFK